jgi:PAS domain S-box-containing protein
MPDRLPVAHDTSRWVKYGVASALIALPALVLPLLGLPTRVTFGVFFAAVAVVSALWGLWPGLYAIALASVSTLLFIAPRAPAAAPSPVPLSHTLGLFAGVTFLVALLGELRVRSERRERAQRQWNEVALTSIGDAVIVTDAEGRVLLLNATAQQLTGWSPERAGGRPLGEVFRIINEASREPVEDPATRVCREGKVVGLANHTLLIAADGREIPIDDSGAPIWSEDGAVVGTVLVFRDVTQRRQAERAQAGLLEREEAARRRADHAMREAQAATRAKDQFLAVLSHELRTPLNAISGWVQVLRGGSMEPDEVRRGLEVIERNVQRQTRIIEDVLDVSHILAGKLRLEFAPVRLASVIDEAIEVVEPALRAKPMSLERHVDPELWVLGDGHRLQQVIWNLLSNAIKFTPAHGRIWVSARRVAEQAEIEIRDTGQGIAPEFLPHVFDRFRQEDSSSQRAFGGLGLGLAIVHHVVEMHGGTVEAASEGVNRGATFTLRMPLARVAERAGDAAPRREIRPPTLDGVRVLVVDDEADSRDVVATMLRKAGAQVRAAASADEARSMLSGWSPAVILCDIEMPGEDGYAFIRALRAAGLDMPAIALTAYAGPEDRGRALRGGFQLHLPKPVHEAELRMVVANTARLPMPGPGR